MRATVVLVGFALAALLLSRAFTGFDLASVVETMGSLSASDVLLLLGILSVLITAEAYLSSGFVPGLSVWHGGLAWLGSNAVASVVPGPSDVPLRFNMFRSWGLPTAEAATSTAGPTVMNIALKLVLPALAAIGLAVGGIDLGGVMPVVIMGGLIFGALAVAGGFCFGSERRTAAAGNWIERAWTKLRRRPTPEPPGRLAAELIAQRTRTLKIIDHGWKELVIGAFLVTVIRAGLFVVTLRVVGLSASLASTLALLCVWALVRGLTVLPTMPGDAGVSEFALVSLVTQVSGSATVNTVTAGVLLYRVLTWLLLIPIGGIAIAVWRATLRGDEAGFPR